MLPELQQEIITKALAVSDSVVEAIDMIKKLSIVHGTSFDKLFNLKDFTKLVHILADQFDKSPYSIALKFNTPIAKKYVELASLLNTSVQHGIVAAAKQFIIEGADVNATSAILYFALLPLIKVTFKREGRISC